MPSEERGYVPLDDAHAFVLSTFMPAILEAKRGDSHNGDAPPLEIVLVCSKPPAVSELSTDVPNFDVLEYQGPLPTRQQAGLMRKPPIDITIAATPSYPMPNNMMTIQIAPQDRGVYEVTDFVAFNAPGHFWLTDVWNELEQAKVFEGEIDVASIGPARPPEAASPSEWALQRGEILPRDRDESFARRFGRFDKEHPLVLRFSFKMAPSGLLPRLAAALRCQHLCYNSDY